jgi:hypothetical protein
MGVFGCSRVKMEQLYFYTDILNCNYRSRLLLPVPIAVACSGSAPVRFRYSEEKFVVEIIRKENRKFDQI